MSSIDSMLAELTKAMFTTSSSDLKEILEEGIKFLLQDRPENSGVLVTEETNITSAFLPEQSEIYTQKFYSTFIDYPGGERCDKYWMFQVVYDQAFSADEIAALGTKFREAIRVLSNQQFIPGVNEIARGRFTAPRDRNLVLRNGKPPSEDLNESTLFYVIIPGLMTNYLDECSDRIWRRPNFVPLYLRRYEQAKEPDGSWVLGSGILNSLNTRGSLEISVNAKALNEGGFSEATWAGAIIHEIVHNAGWDHPNGYGDRSQFILAVEDLAKRLASGN